VSSCDLDDYVTTVTTMSSVRSEEDVSSCDLDDYVTTVTTMSSARSEESVSSCDLDGLCDDCHDDELREERRERVEL